MPWRFWILALSLAVVGHWALRWQTFSWLPFPVVVATLLAFTVERPLRYLVGLALVSELLTALPGGIVTAAVLFPWAVRNAARRLERKASLSFLGVIMITVLGQVLILAAFDWAAGNAAGGWKTADLWRFAPWPAMLITWLASAGLAFGLAAGHALFVASTHER